MSAILAMGCQHLNKADNASKSVTEEDQSLKTKFMTEARL